MIKKQVNKKILGNIFMYSIFLYCYYDKTILTFGYPKLVKKTKNTSLSSFLSEKKDLNSHELSLISNVIESMNDHKLPEQRAINLLISGLRKLSLEQSLSKQGYALLEKLQRGDWSNGLQWLAFSGLGM